MIATEPQLASTDEEILACFDTMAELRPHLTRERFVSRVRRQMENGYHLAMLKKDREVIACAGFRLIENLAWGKFMYVDDLVTIVRYQRTGAGRELLEWLLKRARAEQCNEFHLDSGTWRGGAHAFYFKQGLTITCFHFAIKLDGA